MPNADEASGSMLEQNLSGNSEEERRQGARTTKKSPLEWEMLKMHPTSKSSEIQQN